MAPRPEVRPRLVVLEKGSSLRRLVTRYLDGTEIVPVASLEQAKRELLDNPSQALLVNNASVTAALRELDSVSLPYDTPVIVCSVSGTYESAVDLGVSDYLIKPVPLDTLLQALDRLDLKGNTVLIVDDEPEALRLFRRMLASSGTQYRVLRARSGQEAMTVLRSQHPDVVLLDLVMPEMDGFQVLEAKSQDPRLRDIPVIVISARDPVGQPIVSKALAITRQSGLSAGHLLTYIRTIGAVLSKGERSADPAPLAAHPD
jgi:CheY-like chemotaxis protein